MNRILPLSLISHAVSWSRRPCPLSSQDLRGLLESLPAQPLSEELGDDRRLGLRLFLQDLPDEVIEGLLVAARFAESLWPRGNHLVYYRCDGFLVDHSREIPELDDFTHRIASPDGLAQGFLG